jgi:hypothetical protein
MRLKRKYHPEQCPDCSHFGHTYHDCIIRDELGGMKFYSMNDDGETSDRKCKDFKDWKEVEKK